MRAVGTAEHVAAIQVVAPSPRAAGRAVFTSSAHFLGRGKNLKTQLDPEISACFAFLQNLLEIRNPTRGAHWRMDAGSCASAQASTSASRARSYGSAAAASCRSSAGACVQRSDDHNYPVRGTVRIRACRFSKDLTPHFTLARSCGAQQLPAAGAHAGCHQCDAAQLQIRCR